VSNPILSYSLFDSKFIDWAGIQTSAYALQINLKKIKLNYLNFYNAIGS